MAVEIDNSGVVALRGVVVEVGDRHHTAWGHHPTQLPQQGRHVIDMVEKHLRQRQLVGTTRDPLSEVGHRGAPTLQSLGRQGLRRDLDHRR